MSAKQKTLFTLDCKEFSVEAFEMFKQELLSFGIYLTDVDVGLYGECTGDTYILALSDSPLTKKEMKELLREYD